MNETLCRFIGGPKSGQWHMINDHELLAFRGLPGTYFYGRTTPTEFRWMSFS